MIWFAAFDNDIEASYNGEHQKQMEITSKDVMEIKGELASPAALDERLTNLERTTTIWGSVVVTLLSGIFLAEVPKLFEGKKSDAENSVLQINIPKGTTFVTLEATNTTSVAPNTISGKPLSAQHK